MEGSLSDTNDEVLRASATPSWLTAGSPHGAHSVACGARKPVTSLANERVRGASSVLLSKNDRFNHFDDPDAVVLTDFTQG
ncbi:hypothetical protein [Pandoraea commovens]|uniref:hypothetical protein n=1 Tax=Pandoraea commovens TaxID=2508289 RepID=UPI00123FC516|nr:hypothetical protein [Pandoraea commovens]